MVDVDVTLDELMAAREDLIGSAVHSMPQEHRRFLISFEEDEPDWSMLGTDASALPAVRWRQQNLDKLGGQARTALVNRLKEALEV